MPLARRGEGCAVVAGEVPVLAEVAAGVPGLLRSDMVNRSAVVIDCGINTTPNGIVGDVDFAAVRPVVAAITPVPGGVGPVTTMMLLEQTVEAAERAESQDEPALDRYALPDRTPQPAEREL
jgi:methylenetetrahydrofolate dehydrogenase (NADP+)/methenyltetrahydrofolate cyclohydrolase